MTLSPDTSIAVAGAGSVGCYVGGLLAAAGRNVTLLLRAPLAEGIERHGLRVSDLTGRDQTLAKGALTLTSAPEAALRTADVVLVTVKSQDTASMAALIAEHAPKNAVVVSLQNGVRNAAVLREAVGPDRRVVDAMVPFNVVRRAGDAPHFHRATSGTIQLENTLAGLRDLLDVPGAPVAEHADIEAALWGKLLVNLNNALNALSDLPLTEQLGDRRWRRLISRQMREGLAVLRAAGIRPAGVEGMPPRVIALALLLPDALFRIAAKGMLAVDQNARSSMWEDLRMGRPTEIDYLQGEIVRQAEEQGLAAPLNRRVLQRVKEAEKARKGSPKLSPAALDGA
jgi:2-dehydropantoate 2-reductase